VLTELLLSFLDDLLPQDQVPLAALRLRKATIERVSGLRDLLHLRLQARVQFRHLFPFLPDRPRVRAEDGLLLREDRLAGLVVSFEIGELGRPLREGAALGLEFCPDFLRPNRQERPLGLDLYVLLGSAFFELPQDHAARLLHGLKFRPQGVEFLLADRASLVLLLQLPLSAIQFLFAVHELLFLFPLRLEFLQVRLPFRRFQGFHLCEDPVRIADPGHRRVRIAPLEVVEADLRVAVVVRPDLELGARARRVLEDLLDRVGACDVHLGAVFREDAIPAPQDEHALGGRVPPEHGGLEEAVEFHGAEFGQDRADRLRAPVRDPFHSAGRDFHMEKQVCYHVKKFPTTFQPLKTVARRKRSRLRKRLLSARRSDGRVRDEKRVSRPSV
jgi:hypothetical protein